jgi:hypothetical protein
VSGSDVRNEEKNDKREEKHDDSIHSSVRPAHFYDVTPLVSLGKSKIISQKDTTLTFNLEKHYLTNAVL